MTDDEAITLRVTPDIKAAAERKALADGRSVASLVRKLLRDFLEQSGELGAGRQRKISK